MRRGTTALVSMAAVVAVLAGCGADDVVPTGAPETSESTAEQQPTSDAPPDNPGAGDPPFPASTARQFARHQGDWGLVLADVRVAEHEGFDRIVLEFTGPGTPGWAVSYVDLAMLEGSGRVVKLDGDTVLDIHASGATWPAAGYYAGPNRLVVDDDGAGVVDVFVGGTFEGYTQVLAGIGGDAVPFRVFVLTDPSRLVVDVRSRQSR